MSTTTDHASRARILDVREERRATSRFEFRDTDTGDFVLEGYAATFTPYDVYGGPDKGGWVETLAASAFDVTLGQKPDVQLLVNHEGLPLARTIAGTMDLSRDAHGLKVIARLDRSDPDVQSLAPKLKPQRNGRSNMDEMSFAFRVKNQEWDDSYTNRLITEVSLHKGDVSVVNYGMNPGTRAALQQGVEALQSLSHKELVELRRLDPDLVHRAEVALATMGDEKRGWRAADEHELNNGVCTTCADAAARAKTPSEYANVGAFADPGYLDAAGNQAKGGNGQKRYPIDEKHVQAAWSYINQAKNQKGYTAEQLASVKNKIKAAMKKFGHEVSEDKGRKRSSADQLAAGVSHYDFVRNAQGGTTMIAVLYDGTRTALPGTPAAGITTGSAPTPGDKRLGGMFPYVWTGAEGRDRDDDDDDHDEDCDGDHDDDEDCNDNERAFGGKQAPPFKKGGGQGDDDDEDERATSTRPGGKLGGGTDDDDDDEGRKRSKRAAAPSAQAELSDYEGTDAKAGAHEDEGKPNNEDEHEVELSLPKGPIRVERMLREFRGHAGLPEITNVSEGLAYLRRA